MRCESSLKGCLFLLSILLVNTQLIAQNKYAGAVNKPIIDSEAIVRWPALEYDPVLANDGEYIAYTISNYPIDHSTLIIKSLKNEWKWEVTDASVLTFSYDSKRIVLQKEDTIWILRLGYNIDRKIIGVKSLNKFNTGYGKLIAYRLKNAVNDLVLLDLIDLQEKIYTNVTDYFLDANASNVLLKYDVVTDSSYLQTLYWESLLEKRRVPVWSDKSKKDVVVLKSAVFDEQSSQCAILIERNDASKTESSSGKKKEIWHGNAGMVAVKLLDDKSSAFGDSIIIDGSLRFTKNGEWILFNIRLVSKLVPKSANITDVTVWSYKDMVLQPEQARRMKEPLSNVAAVNVQARDVIRVKSDNEELVTSNSTGDLALVKEGYVDYWWKHNPQASCYIVSLKDNSKKIFSNKAYDLSNFSFSPSGNWLVFYNKKESHYFSFNIKDNKTYNITKSINSSFRNEYGSRIIHEAVAPVVGWVNGSDDLILYDNYDIWLIDPSGKKSAKNITNGYGSRNKIKLRVIGGPEDRYKKIRYNGNDTLILIAFSPRNKYNGFYRKVLNVKGDPDSLYMGPFTFYRTASQKAQGIAFDDGMQPIKTKDGNVWAVKRQTTNDFPNYYITENFKDFRPVTDLHPERSYNWLKAELISWKQLDGTMSQGVLYKPENFNPNLKYPLIFNYYEQLSHRLYEFPEPDFFHDNINIPWMVSRGYLVFIPDIHYKPANTSNKVVGEWVYNSVISAAEYLSKLSYVNSQKMGIQGHSFGGLETNYLVTHTKRFAAAMEAAGITDPISAYLTLVPMYGSPEHFDRQNITEQSHEFYGASPWERPNLYKKGSAVLAADKVVIPLLIMHNEKDNNIQWRQGIEFYMALRRLGKKVWMLQYENGGHGATFRKDAIDYTIRVNQFFDYYLKGMLPPRWMTEGIPAKLKGVDAGFQLDSSGKIP